MKAMILAAGLGQRMQPLTHILPKPLLQVGSLRLIEHHLKKLSALSIAQVIINVSHLAEKMQTILGNGERWGLEIIYSYEPTPLETAGGIRQALPLLGDQPFICINGDVWTDYSFEPLLSVPLSLAHLVLVPNPDHHLVGDFSLADPLAPISSVVANSAQQWTFSGMSVLNPALFREENAHIQRLGPLLKQAVLHQQVTGEVYRGIWCDIGTPERLLALRHTYVL